MIKNLAIVGGGPAALLIYKRLVESGVQHLTVDIFEATASLGSGMPYGPKGARAEHVTNVSADELPKLVIPLTDWIKTLPLTTLEEFGIDPNDFHEKKVLPRLLFGQYLTAQFHALLDKAKLQKFETILHFETAVSDIKHDKRRDKVVVSTMAGNKFDFDYVIICSGHHWPGEREGNVPGYFDSPYPPSKLVDRFDHAVAIRGSSLTAIDAIRTIARHNGKFEFEGENLIFHADQNSQNFRVVMHSRHGMLPCVRVHMEEPHVAGKPLITPEQINQNMQANDGFLELDFLFEKGFKEPLQESDPKFYETIKNMNLETFVDKMMSLRESIEPFELFKKEYEEAKKSIKQERPVYWKEMLSSLSFAMNYPAKYLSAEDMLRLQKHLMPLISVVIAFVPQGSVEELMALHKAGRLDLIADGEDGTVKISDSGEIEYEYKEEDGSDRKVIYETFIDCIGQRHLSINAFPFPSLVKYGNVSEARLKFRSADAAKKLLARGEKHIEELGNVYYLNVPGAGITDNFQVVDREDKASKRVYLMAVPYIGGYNPDYSGLDFCERASELIVCNILKTSVAVLDPVG